MKRKNLLAIIIAVVLIAFIAVFSMYYEMNDGNIFKFTSANEVAKENKEYYSNGWETEIVAEIKDEVPIPVGFCYEEGTKSEGLIIKDETTDTKYMWVPYSEDVVIEQELSLELNESSEEEKVNIEKYGGFYVAIDTEAEKYDKYIIKIAENDEKYLELKKQGYEEYKKTYEEQTGTKLDLNAITSDEIEELKVLNTSKTDSIETHLMTIEELSLLKNFEAKIGKEIMIKDYKTLTILGNNLQIKPDIEIVNGTDSKLIEKMVDGVPIPKGFGYGGGTVETGLKIVNGNNLIFVWIPVMDMIKTEDKGQDIGEVIKGYFIKAVDEAGGDTEYVSNVYKKYSDEKTEEYKELIESIKKYGGFYISEAELGYDENGASINIYRSMYAIKGEGTAINYVSNGDYYRNVKKENIKPIINNKMTELQKNFKLTYDSAIKTCNDLYKLSESVVSHLTYGIEYDATVLYLLKYGKQADETKLTKEDLFVDSTKIGKYQGSDPAKYRSRAKSGLNGIYGLGGNLAEITREVDGDNIIVRGGNWNVSGKAETLSSKVCMRKEEIAKDQTKIGIRACLYIKTEYKELSKELEQAKTAMKKEFDERISKIKAYQDNKNLFDRKSNIIKEIRNDVYRKIDKETSIAVLQQIVDSGESLALQIANEITYIANYNNSNKYFTYGEIYGKCDKIKLEKIKNIENLTWDATNKTYKTKAGKTTTLAAIRKEAIDEITKIRKEYKDKQIKTYITDYSNSNKMTGTYIAEIKTKAKNELSKTENLKMLNINEKGNYLTKWRDIIELATAFDKAYPSTKEYYSSWKTIKEKALKDIPTKTTKDDVNKIIDQAKKDINDIISAKKKSEPTAKPATPKPATPKPATPKPATGKQYIVALDAGHSFEKNFSKDVKWFEATSGEKWNWGKWGDKPNYDNTSKPWEPFGSEATLTKKTVLYMAEYLKQYSNIKVIFCPRTGDISAGANSSKDLAKVAERPYYARDKKADVYLSVHYNANDSSKVNGTETFYRGTNSTKSKSLASKVLQAVTSTTGLTYRRCDQAGYAMLKDETSVNGMPNALLEAAYVTGNKDSAFLKKEENIKKIAAGAVKGILQYLGVGDKGYPWIRDIKNSEL